MSTPSQGTSSSTCDKGDIEVTAFPKLANERRIRGVIYRDVYWKSVDTVKDVEEVEKVIAEVYA